VHDAALICGTCGCATFSCTKFFTQLVPFCVFYIAITILNISICSEIRLFCFDTQIKFYQIESNRIKSSLQNTKQHPLSSSNLNYFRAIHINLIKSEYGEKNPIHFFSGFGIAVQPGRSQIQQCNGYCPKGST
jgi:hypothetical protein